MKQISVLFLTQYYPPEIGAPQARLSELARGLTHNGVKVTILTAMPNYPQGKLMSGYKRLFMLEKQDGINLYRSFIIPTKSAAFLPRLLNYFSFMFSSFCLGLFLPRTDYLFTESPPLFLGICGFGLSRLKRSKFILNVADLWPESVAELGLIDRSGLSYRLSSRLESFLYRHAALVTCSSRSILENISNRFPQVRTYHLSNGVNPENYPPPAYSEKCKVRVLYAGLHGLAQGLDQILAAAERLLDHKSLEFDFIGDGPEKENLISIARKDKLTNVSFLEPVQKSQIPAVLAEADILIVPLKVQLTGAVPSKLYEAMAASKPVILIAGSEARSIVEDAGCGFVVEPGNTIGLVSAIELLAENPDQRRIMGENGRKAVVRKFNIIQIAEDFSSFLKQSYAKIERNRSHED